MYLKFIVKWLAHSRHSTNMNGFFPAYQNKSHGKRGHGPVSPAVPWHSAKQIWLSPTTGGRNYKTIPTQLLTIQLTSPLCSETSTYVPFSSDSSTVQEGGSQNNGPPKMPLPEPLETFNKLHGKGTFAIKDFEMKD